MGKQLVQIERKDWDVPRAADTLRAAFLQHKTLDVTPALASAHTGLPIGLCQEALFQLVALYPGHMRVGEAGTVRFTFTSLTRPRKAAKRDSLLHRSWVRTRDVIVHNAAALQLLFLLVVSPMFLLTLGAHASALAHWGVLARLPGIGLPLVLVAGLIGTAANMLGLLTLGLFDLLPLLLHATIQSVFALYWPGSVAPPFPWVAQRPDLVVPMVWGLVGLQALLAYRGVWYTLWLNVFGPRNGTLLFLMGSLTGSLFGTLPTRPTPLAEERRLVALIIEQAGIITIPDMMALFGWHHEEAEAHLARILVDYAGSVEVTDEGVLIFRFDTLRMTSRSGQRAFADTTPYYERVHPKPVFFAAQRPYVIALGVLWGTGLLGLLCEPRFAWFPALRLWGDDGVIGGLLFGPTPQGLGLYPYLALALPILCRLPFWRGVQRQYQKRERFLHLLKVAAEPPHGLYMKHPPAEVAHLGGTVDLDHVRADGHMLVKFPEFSAAESAAKRLRAQALLAQAQQPDETVAFDTKD